MRIAVLGLIILGFLDPASAQISPAWAQKAFGARKIQLSASGAGSIQGPRGILLIVDRECLSRSLRKGAQPLFAGFTVDLKDSGSLPYPAWTAHPAAGMTDAGIEAALLAQPCLIGAEEDARTQVSSAADPRRSEQVALDAVQLDRGQRFFDHPLWGVRTGVVAAVIDSGAQLDHPDLKNHIWREPSGSAGYDFINDDTDPSDDNGHGTHVAGLLGAERNNGIGGRGVAEDGLKIMALKTQDADGGGSLADLVNALQWAADHGAEVINLSLSARQKNTAVEGAIQYALAKGAVVVAAAGNDGEEVSATNFFLPSGYARDNPGMISVGSVDALTLLTSSFSNFSSSFIEMGAPGSVSGSLGLLSTFLGSGYKNLSGTSQASPLVSGAAALAIGFYKTHGLPYTPALIENAIELSAFSDAGLTDAFEAGRRLDLDRLGQYLFNSTWVDSTGGFDEN
jgi:thermitase